MRRLLPLVCFYAVTMQAQVAHWLDVPFVKQPADGCGAASIAMVMQYWEHQPASDASDVARIQRALFSEQAHGIYASEMQRYLEQNGFKAYAFHANLALLAHHVQEGRPLIVALQPRRGERLHYLVVAGIDEPQHILLVNDPAQRKLLKFDTPTFEREWKATSNWTLLAVPRTEN